MTMLTSHMHLPSLYLVDVKCRFTVVFLILSDKQNHKTSKLHNSDSPYLNMLKYMYQSSINLKFEKISSDGSVRVKSFIL